MKDYNNKIGCKFKGIFGIKPVNGNFHLSFHS